MEYRTPIKKARGLGAAKHGVEHWWFQRITAVALIPLVLWFIFGIMSHAGADYETVHAWIAQPVVAVLFVLLLAMAFHHAQLGLQVIWEDYIHPHWLQVTFIVVTKFAAVVLGLGGIFAVIKIALGG